MHELSSPELYHAIEYAKSIDEETGIKIMECFQFEQTAGGNYLQHILAHHCRTEPGLSHLFMGPCSDIICVFQNPPVLSK